MPAIHKLLAANRSEIATRIFRSAHELKIRTVALNSHEDRFALHRFKADEASAIKLLSVGESRRNELLNPAEFATWATLSSVLMNLDETVTKN